MYSEGVHMYFGERCTGAGVQHTTTSSITAFHLRNVSYILCVVILTVFVFVTKFHRHQNMYELFLVKASVFLL